MNILFFISLLLILSGYVFNILLTFKKSKLKARDVVIEATKGDNSIHLVEIKKGLNKFVYRRNMIKFRKKTYNSKRLYDICMAYLFSGYTKLKSKSLNILKIFPYKFFLSFIPLFLILLSFVLNSRIDYIVGIIISVIGLIYTYASNMCDIDAINLVKINDNEIKDAVKTHVKLNNLFIFGILINIIRMILEILK